MGIHAVSLGKNILERIRATGPGAVFTPPDFLDLGTRAAVDQALSRQARRGALQRFARGLYTQARTHRIWGPVPPSPEAVVEALARRDGFRVVPEARGSGKVYFTDGPSRRLRIGKTVIALKHATVRRLALAAQPGGEVLLDLLALGRRGAETSARERLQGLDPDRREALRAVRRLAPAWLSDLLKEHGC